MDTSLLKTANLSILAIPAYYVLSVAPHIITVWTARYHWDNANPRSTNNLSRVSAKLGPEAFARLQRGESASANSLENLPLFAAAILAGNLAGLQKIGGWGGLNGFAVQFLVVRALYSVAYVRFGDYKRSFIRSGLFFAGVWLCMKTFLQAARAME